MPAGGPRERPVIPHTARQPRRHISGSMRSSPPISVRVDDRAAAVAGIARLRQRFGETPVLILTAHAQAAADAEAFAPLRVNCGPEPRTPRRAAAPMPRKADARAYCQSDCRGGGRVGKTELRYHLRAIEGLRGRFGMYMPPLLEALGPTELTHDAKNNRMRAK